MCDKLIISNDFLHKNSDKMSNRVLKYEQENNRISLII